MSYRLSSQLIGAEELARAFRQARQVTIRELSAGIEKSAHRTEFLAKAKAPIEYGNLRGSITTQGPRVTTNNVEASVGTNLDYARYQEEGTGLYGPRKQVITPKSGTILAWKRGGKWTFARSVKGVKPQRYFKKSREEVVPFFTERMREALATIVTHLARG